MANPSPHTTDPVGPPGTPPPGRKPAYRDPSYWFLVLLLLAAIGWGVWATWFQ